MASWRTMAVVWVNDEKRGRVIVGAYGFAWWEDGKIHIGSYQSVSQPMTGFRSFKDWDKVQSYQSVHVPMSAVLRFVRTGFPPVQGKLKAD